MARQKILPPIQVLRTFHRSRDGFIALAKKVDGSIHPWAGLPVASLNEWFPSIIEELSEDGYFMPNTVGQVGSVSKRTGYPYPIPKNRNVKYLNANFVDIDCHVLNIPWTTAMAVLLQYADQDVVPMPSFIARSGRGLYGLWVLRDEDDQGAAPLANYKDNRERWRAIETGLIKRMENIGADAIACNEARWLRLPGSIHTGADGRPRTTYMVLLDKNGVMPVYTMPQMISLMGITFAPLPEITSPPLPPRPADATYSRRRYGPGTTRMTATHRLRAREIEILSDLRGGFREGMREQVLWVYACSLRSAGMDEGQVWDQCQRLAAAFKPHLDVARIHAAVSRRTRVSRWRNFTLARWFNVTDDEAEFLTMLVPHAIRAKRDKDHRTCQAAREAERMTKQREFIRIRSAPRGDELSLRTMAKKIGVHPTTVMRWDEQMLRREYAEYWEKKWVATFKDDSVDHARSLRILASIRSGKMPIKEVRNGLRFKRSTWQPSLILRIDASRER